MSESGSPASKISDEYTSQESEGEICDENELEELKYPREGPSDELEEILPSIRDAKKKLDKKSASLEEITTKCKNLNNILDYLEKCKEVGKCPPNTVFGEIVEMVAVNLFRRLPYQAQPPCPDALEEEKYATEPLWEHINLVYTILQRLIVLEGNLLYLRMHVSERFRQQLVELFHSDDLRERDKLKVVLHRAYCKVYVWRPFLRKKIKEILLRHIHDEETRGVNQILQLYGCVVSGFSVPLRDEHIRFLEKILIPLHKPEDVSEYHTFLTYCLMRLLYLDETLTKTIFFGILKQWPKTNSQKEILFLEEVEFLLQVLVPEQFNFIIEPLIRQITNCMISPNVEVAKKAYSLWENQRVLTLAVLRHETIMPLMLPVLYSMRKQHWNPTITNLLYGLLKSFMIVNRSLFIELVNACTISNREQQNKEKKQTKSVHFKTQGEDLSSSTSDW